MIGSGIGRSVLGICVSTKCKYDCFAGIRDEQHSNLVDGQGACMQANG
jgi:hypothetical protein